MNNRYEKSTDLGYDTNSNINNDNADFGGNLTDDLGVDINASGVKDGIGNSESGEPVLMRYTPPPPDFYIPPPIPHYEVINDNTDRTPPYLIDESGDNPVLSIPQREPDYDDGKDPIGDSRVAENLNAAELENRNVPEQLPPDDFEDLNAFEPQEVFETPEFVDAPNFDAVPADIGFAPDFNMPIDF